MKEGGGGGVAAPEGKLRNGHFSRVERSRVFFRAFGGMKRLLTINCDQ